MSSDLVRSMFGTFVLSALLSLNLSSCSSLRTGYAELYISVKNKNGIEESHDVYSAKDGLYYGLSPLTVPLKRTCFDDSDKTQSLIVKDTIDGSPLGWSIVTISKWANSRLEAKKPELKSEVLFRLK